MDAAAGSAQTRRITPVIAQIVGDACIVLVASGLALLTERLWPGAGVAVAAGAAIVIARLAELVRDEMRKQED